MLMKSYLKVELVCNNTCDYSTMSASTSNSLDITSRSSITLSLGTHASSRECCGSIFYIRRLYARYRMRRGNHTYPGAQTKLPFTSIAPTPHLSYI
jgi:hypothetical protein